MSENEDEFFFKIFTEISAIGSICILTATFIIDKLEIPLIHLIVIGFLLTGALMLVCASSVAVFMNLRSEHHQLIWFRKSFVIIPGWLSFFTFFISSILLLVCYIISLF